jgi:serine/threonine-protein kinase
VHRDIKPTNIMITAEDQVKLVDFGIAISDRSADLTAPGFMVGSVNYMSPEQIAGDKATARSDLYSVGVTLYEILTGWLPVTGATNLEIMRSHLNDRPAPPAELNPRLPVVLSNALMKALEKSPDERFATAQEFLTALDAVPSVGINDVYCVETTALHRPASESVQPVAPKSGSQATQQKSGQATQQKSSSQVAQFPVDDVSKKLAVYIGPIATVVVRKLAAKCSDLEQLYQEAATHISSEADRLKFLQSRRK